MEVLKIVLWLECSQITGLKSRVWHSLLGVDKLFKLSKPQFSHL